MPFSYVPRRWLRSRAARIAVAVVVTLPLAFSAVYMWAMWDPTHVVNKLPVALVNSDQPVVKGTEQISAGRDVTTELLDSGALDWQQVDHQRAMEGVRKGDYYFAIEIPKDFSRTIAGIGDGTKAPAQIDVTFNDTNATYTTPVGNQVMAEINKAVLKGVSQQVAEKVLVGLNDLGQGMHRAADGAGQLKDGTVQLKDGAAQLRTGVTGELAPGMQQAATGGHDLDAGAGRLADGLVQLQNGTDRLGAGATELSAGIDRLVGLADNDGSLAAQARALHEQAAALPGPAGKQVESVVGKVDELLDGLQRLRAGGHEIKRQLLDPTADYRSGLNQLVAGGGELKAGADKLSTGLDQLNAGVGRVADGAVRLDDGATRLDEGAGQLDTGLSDGVKQVPDLSNGTVRANLASLVTTPVTSESRNFARAQDFGPGAAPLLLVVGSVLASIVVWMTFRVDRDPAEELDGAVPSYNPVRRLVAVGFISLVAMGALIVCVWLILDPGPHPVDMGKFLLVTAVGTLMSVALVGLGFVMFGYIGGTLAALAVFMLQLFAFGGVWMVETVPAPFRLLHNVTPLTYMRKGLVDGMYGTGGAWSAILVMVLIGAVAVAAQIFLVRKGWSRYPHTSELTSAPEPARPEPVQVG